MELVVAVLVAVVLLADRFIPRDELGRRLYQVAFDLLLVISVAALAALFFPVASNDLIAIGSSNPSPESSMRLQERLIFVLAAGSLLIFVGLSQSRSLPTLSIGAVLAGVLLLATHVSAFGNPYNVLFAGIIASDPSRNAIYAAVAILGVLALMVFGYTHWDRPDSWPEVEEPLTDESSREATG